MFKDFVCDPSGFRQSQILEGGGAGKNVNEVIFDDISFVEIERCKGDYGSIR